MWEICMKNMKEYRQENMQEIFGKYVRGNEEKF